MFTISIITILLFLPQEPRDRLITNSAGYYYILFQTEDNFSSSSMFLIYSQNNKREQTNTTRIFFEFCLDILLYWFCFFFLVKSGWLSRHLVSSAGLVRASDHAGMVINSLCIHCIVIQFVWSSGCGRGHRNGTAQTR